MRRAVRAAALALAIAAAGCSGSDDSGSIQDFCNRGAPAICARIFACDPTTAAQVYGTQAQCTSQSSSQCSSAACPSGKTFDQAAADQCVAAYPNASCSDLAQGTYPTVCTTVCR
ncbi:MAG: hypothetical protein ACXWLF_06230 [Myxococcaceae bacterium]